MPSDKEDKNHVAYVQLKQLFDRAPHGILSVFDEADFLESKGFPLSARLRLNNDAKGYPYATQYANVLNHVSNHLDILKQAMGAKEKPTTDAEQYCTAAWIEWLSKIWDNAPHMLVRSPGEMQQVIAAKEKMLESKLTKTPSGSPERELILQAQHVVQTIKAELFDKEGRLTNVRNKRLLLEVMSQSIQLAMNPQTPRPIAALLDQLDKQHFKPLGKLLKSAVDFAISHWGWAKKLERSGFYGSLTRHSDDRKIVHDLREQMAPLSK